MERCPYASEAYTRAYELASKIRNVGIPFTSNCSLFKDGKRCTFAVTAKATSPGVVETSMQGDCTLQSAVDPKDS